MGRKKSSSSGNGKKRSSRNNKAANTNNYAGYYDDDDDFALGLDLLGLTIGDPLEYDIGTRVELNLKVCTMYHMCHSILCTYIFLQYDYSNSSTFFLNNIIHRDKHIWAPSQIIG